MDRGTFRIIDRGMGGQMRGVSIIALQKRRLRLFVELVDVVGAIGVVGIALVGLRGGRRRFDSGRYHLGRRPGDSGGRGRRCGQGIGVRGNALDVAGVGVAAAVRHAVAAIVIAGPPVEAEPRPYHGVAAKIVPIGPPTPTGVPAAAVPVVPRSGMRAGARMRAGMRAWAGVSGVAGAAVTVAAAHAPHVTAAIATAHAAYVAAIAAHAAHVAAVAAAHATHVAPAHSSATNPPPPASVSTARHRHHGQERAKNASPPERRQPNL